MRRAFAGHLVTVLTLSATLSLATVGTQAADPVTFQREGDQLTIHCDDVPARDLLGRLENDGLATLSGPPGIADRRVTIHVEKVSLEIVMRHLLRQIGVSNHAVRYAGKSGLATFVVLSEDAPKVRVANQPAAAPAPAPAAPPPPPERKPRPPRAEPERGFGMLLAK